MALIKLSFAISDIQGSIQGTTFIKSIAGNVMKAKTSPVNKNTLPQNLKRVQSYTVQQAWFNFSDSQRAVWSNFAKFAGIRQRNFSGKKAPGQSLHFRGNSYLMEYNESIITEPAFVKNNISTVSFTVDWEAGSLFLNLTENQVPDIFMLIIQSSLPVSGGINNPSGRLRTIQYDKISNTRFDITNDFYEVFGYVPVPNDVIFVKHSVLDKANGLLLPFFTQKYTVSGTTEGIGFMQVGSSFQIG